MRPQTITKQDLVDHVSAKSGQSKVAVEGIVKLAIEYVADTLAQRKRVEIRDFGVLEGRQRKPRTAKNPRTNVQLQIGPRVSVRFKPGKRLLERVAAGWELDEANQPRATAALEVKPPAAQAPAGSSSPPTT